MRLLLIRHGESEKNLTDSFGDRHAGSGLTDNGLRESKHLASLLSAELASFRRSELLLLSSPEPRASRSAEIIGQTLGIDLIVDESLNPIDSGDLSGLTEVEARRAHPDLMHKKDLYRAGRLNGFDLSYPHGEAVAAFQNRVVTGFLDIIRGHDAHVTIVVGHQSTITALLSHYRSQTEGGAFYYYYSLAPCSITALDLDAEGSGRIVDINRSTTTVNQPTMPPLDSTPNQISCPLKLLAYQAFAFCRILKAKCYVLWLRTMFHSIGSHVFIYPHIFFKDPHKIRIGDECIVRRGVTLNGRSKGTVGISLGTGVTIRESCYLDAYEGKIVLDDYCGIGHRCIIGGHGGLYVGKYSLIGGMTYIIPSNHVFTEPTMPFMLQGESRRGIRIGANVWIGAGCIILDGVDIGDNSVIGAGSLVSNSIPSGVVAFGSPAKVRRQL
jgi:acetyltransferase-like isoleucine patch superfamily enzyme/broad specificity phosphatase PhoE